MFRGRKPEDISQPAAEATKNSLHSAASTAAPSLGRRAVLQLSRQTKNKNSTKSLLDPGSTDALTPTASGRRCKSTARRIFGSRIERSYNSLKKQAFAKIFTKFSRFF